MSLLLAGLVIAGTSGALVVGRWLARWRGEAGKSDERDEKAPSKEDADEAAGRAEVEAEAPKRDDEDVPKAPAET
ncbi:MAG: hypothetical protein K0S65_5546, partial [Labilithrix sp.]|nr:hypothetical protein [Labilithrix sp.]